MNTWIGEDPCLVNDENFSQILDKNHLYLAQDGSKSFWKLCTGCPWNYDGAMEDWKHMMMVLKLGNALL